MPFCAGCGRKLDDGEICSCTEQQKTVDSLDLSDEFFSSVGRAIDQAAETAPFEGDEDITIHRPEKRIPFTVRRKIDDAGDLEQTRKVASLNEFVQQPVETAAQKNYKKPLFFAAGGLLLASLLVLLFLLLGKTVEPPKRLAACLQNGTDLVLVSLEGDGKKITVPGKLSFLENNVQFNQNKSRVFFFAFGGTTLCYIDLTGKDWTKNEVMVVDDGFFEQRYWLSPDGERVLYQKQRHGGLFGVDIKQRQRFTLSEEANDVFVGKDFSTVFFSEGGAHSGVGARLFQVDLPTGWQVRTVVDGSYGECPFFGDENGVYFLADKLYRKPISGVEMPIAMDVCFLAYQNAQGRSVFWKKGEGVSFADDDKAASFDGSFYFGVERTLDYPLSYFLAPPPSGEAEEQQNLNRSLADIVGLKWSLENNKRYFIVNAVAGTAVSLQYACYDEAEGYYVTSRLDGTVSSPKALTFSVGERGNTQSYTVELQNSAEGSRFLLTGGEDGMVIKGEYLLAKESDPDRWKKELYAEAENTPYPQKGQVLYFFDGKENRLAAENFVEGKGYCSGVLTFSSRMSGMNEIDLFSMEEELTLSELTIMAELLVNKSEERDFCLAVKDKVYPISPEQYRSGRFFTVGNSIYYFFQKNALYSVAAQGETLGVPAIIGGDISTEWAYFSEKDMLLFKDCKGELGTLTLNGAKLDENVYLSSCVFVNEGDTDRFFYQRYTESGRELWLKNEKESLLICSSLSGEPVFSGDKALYLQNFRSGEGELTFFDGEKNNVVATVGMVLSLAE